VNAPAGYSSLRAFYEANSSRVPAPEPDFGLWWREARDGPVYRAAWVEATGEFYIVRCDAPANGGSEVEVLAVTTDRRELEKGLTGWRSVCGQEHSLEWLRSRAEALVGV
jgi:hypothetical protein